MDDERPDQDPPPWLDVDDLELASPAASAGRTRRLLALAVLPWTVAAVVVFGELRSAPPADDAPSLAPGAPASPVDAAPRSTEAVTALPSPRSTAPVATLVASGARTAVGPDEARAVAVVAARRWLTTVGPDDDVPGGGDDDAGAQDGGRYAEHLVVEGVDHPAPGAAVVTIRAVVLHVAGDGYDAVEVQRLAVPLRYDASGARLAGEPYRLPLDDPPGPEPLDGLVPIEDVDVLLQAAEAVQAAGYADVSLHSLHRSEGWPLLATADVRLTADGPRTRVVVWLREHLRGFVVAGTRPAREPANALPSAPASQPQPVPSEHPSGPHPEEATP